MELLEELNILWVDCISVFLMLSFLYSVGVLLWQHFKNQKAQKELIANYNQNLKILQNLKNRF